MLRTPLLLLLSGAFVASAVAQSVPKTPINDLPAVTGNSDHDLRAASFSLAAQNGPGLDKVHPYARNHQIQFLQVHPMPELPGNFSDTIVLGTVINMQPYLTSNH